MTHNLKLPMLGPERMCLLSIIPLSLSLKEHHCFHYSKNRKDFGVGVDLDPRNLTGECTRGEHVASKKKMEMKLLKTSGVWALGRAVFLSF